jgi:hypothetical protein
MGRCAGTMILSVFSSACFCSRMWLPCCRTTTQPPRWSARTTRSYDRFGTFVKRRFSPARRDRWTRAPPVVVDRFEVQLDRFADVCQRVFARVAASATARTRVRPESVL